VRIFAAKQLVDASFGFDANSFVYLAQNYRFTINEQFPSIAHLCLHNYQVAQQAQQHMISLVWSVIKQTYCVDGMMCRALHAVRG
jgi:hypothetical protein